MRRACRGFKGAATASRRLGYDVQAMRAMREVAAENNAEMFRTRGAASGDSWRGERAGSTTLDDAVDTGRLRDNMTHPYLLKPRVQARKILFGVPKRRVPYIKYMSDRVYGWTPRGRAALAEVVAKELGRIARGEREP